MALDSALPANLMAEIADLKRRLANLERSPSIPSSSTRGGVFQFLDEDGNLRWGMGNVALPDNSFIDEENVYGVTGWDDGGAVVFAALEGDRGLVYPVLHAGFHSPSSVSVTSGTFAAIFETYADHPPAPVLRVDLAIVVDAATTAEVKMVDGVSASSTSTVSLGASYNGVVSFEWLHPSTSGIGDDRVGRQPSFFPAIQVRRASGAGTVFVFPPTRQYYASTSAYPDADANGNPSS